MTNTGDMRGYEEAVRIVGTKEVVGTGGGGIPCDGLGSGRNRGDEGRRRS